MPIDQEKHIQEALPTSGLEAEFDMLYLDPMP